MATSLTEDAVLRKLETSLQSTQEAIETVSLWCLHHKDQHATICNAWLKYFKVSTQKNRLALLFLVNDVCQKERRKRLDGFRNCFSVAITEVVVLARSDEIRDQVERLFKIWEERCVFDKKSIDEWKAILDRSQLQGSNDYVNESGKNPMLDFKLEALARAIDDYHAAAGELETKAVDLPPVPFHPDSDFKATLKNREDGLKSMWELSQAYGRIESYIREFEQNLHRQNKLITLLEQAGLFYETQLSEAQFVETAYRKFGSSIKAVIAEIEALVKSDPFLTVSPPQDAPSPSPMDDPFPMGVEAVFAETKKKAESQAVDMELDDEDKRLQSMQKSASSISEDIQVATNRTFLLSPFGATTSSRQGDPGEYALLQSNPKRVRRDTPDSMVNSVGSSFSSAAGSMSGGEAPVDPSSIAGTSSGVSVMSAVASSSPLSSGGAFVPNCDHLQQRPFPMRVQSSESQRQTRSLLGTPPGRSASFDMQSDKASPSGMLPLTIFSTAAPADPASVQSPTIDSYGRTAFGREDLDMRAQQPAGVADPAALGNTRPSPKSPSLPPHDWSSPARQNAGRPGRIARLLPTGFGPRNEEFSQVRLNRRERTLLSTPKIEQPASFYGQERIPVLPVRGSSRPALLPLEPNGSTFSQTDHVVNSNNVHAEPMDSFHY